MDNFIPIIAAIVSFVVTAALGIPFIPYLKKLKYGQTILDIGPNWHKSKQGTPTMGGFMFILVFADLIPEALEWNVMGTLTISLVSIFILFLLDYCVNTMVPL